MARRHRGASLVATSLRGARCTVDPRRAGAPPRTIEAGVPTWPYSPLSGSTRLRKMLELRSLESRRNEELVTAAR